MVNAMEVKVKAHDILHSTDKATLFLFNKQEIWLPNSLWKHYAGNYIAIPKWLAVKNKLNSKIIKEKVEIFHHIPEKINKEIFIDESLIK